MHYMLLLGFEVLSQFKVLKSVYFALVYLYLMYGTTLRGSTYKLHLYKIKIIKKRIVTSIYGAGYNAHTHILFTELGLLNYKTSTNMKYQNLCIVI